MYPMRYLILSCFLLCAGYCGAQSTARQHRIDSLLSVVASMKEDTLKAQAYSSIALEYVRVGKDDEALPYTLEGLAICQRLHWQMGELNAYIELGNIYDNITNYPAALDAYFKAMRINDALQNKYGSAILSGNISNVYLNEKDYQQALKYSQQFLRLARELNDTTGLVMALGSVGGVYESMGNGEEALRYQQQALAVATADNDTGSIATILANIAPSFMRLKQYRLALTYSFQALALGERKDYTDIIPCALGNIGESYLRISKDSNAYPADDVIPPTKHEALKLALSYLQRAIAIDREQKNYQFIMNDGANLAEVLALTGNYKEAFAAYKESAAARDTIFNTDNLAQIHRLESRRALELKERDLQIAKLEVVKKRNERGFFIGGIVLLLGIMAVLAVSYRKQQRSNKQLAGEKKRSDDLLLNILPAEVADELKDHGNSVARHFDEVTVLFTDFVNFTTISEHLSPDRLVKELHECFSAFDAIIERNGLEKIKTVGDAYIAVSGLPVYDDRHASRCVRAAMEIRDYMEHRSGGIFQIRMGLNTGPVVAGIVGVKKFAYDIWGDTVNTAARMEQHGEAGRINISQTTYELVRYEFSCTRRGKIAAKHKGEVEMFFVEAPVAKAMAVIS